MLALKIAYLIIVGYALLNLIDIIIENFDQGDFVIFIIFMLVWLAPITFTCIEFFGIDRGVNWRIFGLYVVPVWSLLVFADEVSAYREEVSKSRVRHARRSFFFCNIIMLILGVVYTIFLAKAEHDVYSDALQKGNFKVAKIVSFTKDKTSGGTCYYKISYLNDKGYSSELEVTQDHLHRVDNISQISPSELRHHHDRFYMKAYGDQTNLILYKYTNKNGDIVNSKIFVFTPN